LSRVPGMVARASQRRDPGAPGYFDALAEGEPLPALLASGGGCDVVVNAIGLTQAELKRAGDAEAARKINAELPHRLSSAAAAAGARLIHVSTDGVFSGTAGPYDEDRTPDPQDLYGRTKLAGEVRGDHVLTLRCSLVGPEPRRGQGLLEWLRAVPRGTHVPGYVDQLWNGVTTLQMAKLVVRLLDPRDFRALTAVASVRHFCPNSPMTKYELLRLLAAAFRPDVQVDPTESGVRTNRILTSRWDDPARLVGAPVAMNAAIRELLEEKAS
ncbi:MAG TPA: sugar nucleotide-binding protein, partial [Myxococcaceae bacterium]